MNAQIQKLLSGLAQCAGLTIEFPDGPPIRICGFENGPPFVLISPDQNDSEIIFDILQKIGLVATNNHEFPLPWILNRPYENELAGNIAYKTRRIIRQKYNSGSRAEVWALCAYARTGFTNQFGDFLKRHPEKMKLMPLVWYGSVKTPAPGKVLTGFSILRSMFVAIFRSKKS